MIESIGKKLREVREARNLTLEQVSQALRIRPYHLQALETDDYSAIPSAAQARGFLRNYAEFLGLNVEELVPAVRPQIAEPPPPSPTTPTMIPPAQASTEAPSGTGGLGSLLSGLRGRLARRPEAGTPEAGSAVPAPPPDEAGPPPIKIGGEIAGMPVPDVQAAPVPAEPMPNPVEAEAVEPANQDDQAAEASNAGPQKKRAARSGAVRQNSEKKKLS